MKFTNIIRVGLLAALASFFITVSASPLTAGPTDGVAGCWRTISDKDGKVKSKVCLWENKKGKLLGVIKKLYNPDEPNPKCTKCTGKQKNKPIEGLLFLWGLKKGSDAWEKGWILDPENGKRYKAKIWRKGNKLKVRGYIGFLYRTQTWVK